MLSFVSTLASQIGYLIQSLNEDNFRSVTYELTRFTGYGLDGSIVLLHTCLDQVNLCEGDVQSMQLKLDLLAIVVKYLLHQSNFSTVFCEALKSTHASENVLGDLSKALHLSLPEQIGLGLALADSDDTNRSQEGENFCKVKIMELYQNPVAGVSEELIEQVLLFLNQSEGLSKLVPSFLQALSLLQPKSQMSLLLTPLCTNEVYEVNSLRSFESCASRAEGAEDILPQVEEATNVADVMEDLGYGCTIDVPHCKNVLLLFSPINEKTISKIIGMVVRTHTGLEDTQGIHSTFCTAVFNCSTADSSWLTSWNIDVLLDSIRQLASDINWVSVMDNLDHADFYLLDQKAFSLSMSIHAKVCQDPFHLQAVCGSV